MAGNAVLPYTSGMGHSGKHRLHLSCAMRHPQFLAHCSHSVNMCRVNECLSQWRELLETYCCYDLSFFGQDTNKESFGSLMPLWSSDVVQSCAMWQKDPTHSSASCLCPQFKPAEVLPVHRRLSWLVRGNAMFPPSCPVQNEAYLVAT